ncbi:MAG: tetratricopeptide repeat protein, partial [Gammaproteobacteria bacterium]|nr:tetratricopeptide repeat protein [Gammaproteobacteria bacterium]
PPALAQDQDVIATPSPIFGEKRGGALLAVAPPDLSGIEPVVREHLRLARENLAEILNRPEVGDRELREAYGEMGGQYQAHHLHLPAEPCYRNAGQLLPEDFRWPYYLGYLYQQTSRPQLAAESFQRALELRPRDRHTQLRLGQTYLELNRPESAQSLLNRVAEVDGLGAAARYGLGKVALDSREFRKAVRLFEEVLARDPGATMVHYPLAMAYRGLGEMDQARHHLAKRGTGIPQVADPLVAEMKGLVSGARTLFYRGTAAVREERWESARKAFLKGLELEPDNTLARTTLARIHYLSGERDRAQQELAVVLHHAPESALANLLMGVLRGEEGATGAAVAAFYRRAIRTEERNGGANFLLGNIAMEDGDYQAAARHYRITVEETPFIYPARMAEPVALLRSGTSHRLVHTRLVEAVEANPRRALFVNLLVRLLAASNDPEIRNGPEALVLAEKLFAKSSNLRNGEALAMAYAETGRYRDAAAMQKKIVAFAESRGRLDFMNGLKANLRLYAAGKPCRQPFSTIDA